MDRATVPGGLAGARVFRGIPLDVGSHRLHPEALALARFREMAADVRFVTRPRRGVLLLGGRRIAYPPTLTGLARGLGVTAGARMALGYFRATRWERDRRVEASDMGFEDFVVGRVGRAAFTSFYGPYAEKVWGLSPSELSQSMARLRWSTVDPWALVRSLRWGRSTGLGQRGAVAPATEYVYPAEGFHTIATWLLRAAERAGVTVLLGADAPGTDAPAGEGRVVHTGALRDLVPTTLAHRGLYLVFLALATPSLGDAETYYAPEARYWFGRVGDVGNYAPRRVAAGETVLCVEIPEGRWGRGRLFAEGSALETLLAQLRDAGVVPRAVQLIEARQVYVPDVYPVYARGWQSAWRAAMATVAMGTTLPAGRQGLFLHCNTDHCVTIAEAAADHALAGGSTEDWVRRAEAYLALRVRD